MSVSGALEVVGIDLALTRSELSVGGAAEAVGEVSGADDPIHTEVWDHSVTALLGPINVGGSLELAGIDLGADVIGADCPDVLLKLLGR